MRCSLRSPPLSAYRDDYSLLTSPYVDMDRNNALGLTLHPDPEVFNVPDLDWDSVTMVSLDSIRDAIDQKRSSFFKLGRWTSGERRLSITPVWRNAGSQWRRKFSATVQNVRRRLLPTLLHAVRTGLACKVPAAAAPRNHTVVPYAVFSLLTHQCAACQSSFPIHERAVAAPCGHQYHVDCMLTLVETSLQALSSFPPRCCRQTIPSEVFDRYLSRSLRSAYTERQAEYDCPKRVYCANPRCSLFLGSRDKRIPVRVLDCPSSSCDTRTCARCKTRVDGPTSRHECTHDPGYRATLQLGSRMGWVRCPACEELIERHGGCAHMTCVCGTEFCYRCRAEWKTCNCVDWGDGIGADDGEARLFAPLEEGGDLRPRLALWIPPILDRDEDATNRRESWVDVVPTPPPGPRPRPRSRSFVHTRPDSLAAYTAYFLDNTRPGRSSQVPASPKVSLLASRPPTLHLENDIAPYFPFLVDPELLARGIQAQETRRRRRAVSF
ncbi:hypothetical protein L226DRAFT_235366 [Lentinus tigrinus ALCF2SS1-7]|uniref:uncharacterized protein n=1 Tax=Lentinus tigrinus ALCF2SS1-7 TaxID=1328758 RepID=UPI001165E983|nr:hypothetical protein L226DRAFT_235366 [Lentinus tigrinus ALCF2SS1-7]